MIFEKIKDIISEQMSIQADNISMETSFIDDLGADSLDVFQIITELEEYFELEFPLDDLDKIRTVGAAVKYITAALEE